MTGIDPREAASTRQAAAFLLHAGNKNGDGMNAILAELNDEPELNTRFVYSLASVFQTLIPVVYSSTGQWLMQQMLADLAGIEHGNVA